MKNKKLIFGIIIGITVFMIIVFLLMLINDNNKEKDDFKLDTEIINKLLDNSYKYYLIKEGLVKVGDNTIDSNEQSYYNVEEEWLTSFDDVRQLIEDTFLKVRVNTMWNELSEDKVLIMVDNILYISIPEENCEINYAIDKEKIEYRMISDEQARLDLGSIEMYIYKEDNGWRLDSNPYNCNFNI